ncbi:endothelin-converting enzyme-like 1 isoform X2 [Fopius arisanus]|uniref:Endothelin-converting enzyme-like 1 isoform X2 n=1 Tax=Fopius arisanus TaxID=64838 RepID=A0A9R1TWP7_9HYME|nr:PREDICTED: endothelin-converting enzyme-like 1 isoform X2 [Fopius arisanus]
MPSGTYQVSHCEENSPPEGRNRKKFRDRSSKEKSDNVQSPNERYQGSQNPAAITTRADIEFISSTSSGIGESSDRSGRYRGFTTETAVSSSTINPETKNNNYTSRTIDPGTPGDIFMSPTIEDTYQPLETSTSPTESSTSPAVVPSAEFESTTEYYDEQSITPGGTTISEEFYSSTEASESFSDSSQSSSGADTTSSSADPSTTRATRDFTSLKRLIVAKYFGNDSSTTEDPSNDNWLDDLNMKTSTEETITVKEAETSTGSTTSTPEYNRDVTPPPEDSKPLGNSTTCTGKCRQQFSKMMAWMNHSANPCEDFYEFACGGLEADPEMIIITPEERALSVIKKQMLREITEGRSSRFYNYYQSCVGYGKNTTLRGIMLDSIRQLSQNAISNNLSVTRTLKVFQFLFDITTAIDESNPQELIPRIGASLPSIALQIFRNDSCDPKNIRRVSLDLDEMYEEYKSCKNNTNELLDAITEIFGTEFPLDFFRTLLSDFPSESEIREAYRSKNYTLIALSDLQKQSTLISWGELLLDLTGVRANNDTKLQIYFKDNLFRALRRIDDHNQRHPSHLLKFIIAFNAGNIYNELQPVLPRDLESKCLKITANWWLSEDASYLYMSSFTYDELNTIKSKVADIFKQLKQTLTSKLETIYWASPEGRDALIKKLNDIQISMPEASYFEQKENEVYPNFIQYFFTKRPENISDLNKTPGNPQILKYYWTHLAKAFQPLPRSLHSRNLILVPLGAVESLRFTKTNEKYDYMTLASVGNLLAHEIASYFDVIGIQYWDKSRGSPFPSLKHDDFTRSNYENYIKCQRDEIFKYSTEIVIPATNQLVKLMIPPHTLNERLSDAAGVRLAHDTFHRLAAQKSTPWLDFNNDQLFYIAYAQTHCTKAPLTASSISLHENPELPSRLRVYAAGISDRRIGRAFECPEGSKLSPDFSCGAFPYIEDPIPAA